MKKLKILVLLSALLIGQVIAGSSFSSRSSYSSSRSSYSSSRSSYSPSYSSRSSYSSGSGYKSSANNYSGGSSGSSNSGSSSWWFGSKKSSGNPVVTQPSYRAAPTVYRSTTVNNYPSYGYGGGYNGGGGTGIFGTMAGVAGGMVIGNLLYDSMHKSYQNTTPYYGQSGYTPQGQVGISYGGIESGDVTYSQPPAQETNSTVDLNSIAKFILIGVLSIIVISLLIVIL